MTSSQIQEAQHGVIADARPASGSSHHDHYNLNPVFHPRPRSGVGGQWDATLHPPTAALSVTSPHSMKLFRVLEARCVLCRCVLLTLWKKWANLMTARVCPRRPVRVFRTPESAGVVSGKNDQTYDR